MVEWFYCLMIDQSIRYVWTGDFMLQKLPIITIDTSKFYVHKKQGYYI